MLKEKLANPQVQQGVKLISGGKGLEDDLFMLAPLKIFFLAMRIQSFMFNHAETKRVSDLVEKDLEKIVEIYQGFIDFLKSLEEGNIELFRILDYLEQEQLANSQRIMSRLESEGVLDTHLDASATDDERKHAISSELEANYTTFADTINSRIFNDIRDFQRCLQQFRIGISKPQHQEKLNKLVNNLESNIGALKVEMRRIVSNQSVDEESIINIATSLTKSFNTARREFRTEVHSMIKF